jgi:hypothetical protein
MCRVERKNGGRRDPSKKIGQYKPRHTEPRNNNKHPSNDFYDLATGAYRRRPDPLTSMTSHYIEQKPLDLDN